MKSLTFSIPAVLLAVFLLAGCQPEPVQDSTDPESRADGSFEAPRIEGDQVLAADHTVLLEIADIPESIAIDDDTQFGASGRFVQALASPGQHWLALVTAGTAHSSGWILGSQEQTPLPAAFQYGGELEVGPWSDDEQFVAFIHRGPAGGQSLSVTIIDQLGGTLENASATVRLPEDDELPPDERFDQPIEWQGQKLLFDRNGQRWLFDPVDRNAEQLNAPSE